MTICALCGASPADVCDATQRKIRSICRSCSDRLQDVERAQRVAVEAEKLRVRREKQVIRDEKIRLCRESQRCDDGRLVYFIRAGSDGSIKIGLSGNPRGRLEQLQTSHPEKLVLLGIVGGGMRYERELHEKFAAVRLSGEWFEPTAELLEFIAWVCR